MKKLIQAIDVFVADGRMRNLFRDALKIYSEQAGLNIIFNKDGCFWRDLDKPVMFSCDWSSSYNTLGTMNTYALYLADRQTIKDWDQFNYHQFGERITPSNFVWLPRLDESWPTSCLLYTSDAADE